jgi:predicted transcriptional regulator with HTH domain
VKESKLQRSIRKYLEEVYGAFFFKTHGSEFQISGLPDLVGCLDGLFVAIEVKRPGKDASLNQLAVIKRIRRAGGIAFVARSIKEAERKLKRGLKDKTIQVSKKSSKKSFKKEKFRLVPRHENRKDTHYSSNPRKVVAKRKKSPYSSNLS